MSSNTNQIGKSRNGAVTKNKLKIIEDCAHAIETEYKNKKTGTFGETGSFSFYANKHITTGEGGMILTNNKKIYDWGAAQRTP